MKLPKILNFKREEKKPEAKNTFIRSFKGAQRSRFSQWIYSTLTPINRDLKSDLQNLIVRSRDLAKNNELMRSHLNNLQKSIIGSSGFRLQSLIKNPDGTLNESLNNEIENAWWSYTKSVTKPISKSNLFSDIDFDCLILRTLIVDGEVFIKVDKNARNKWGISFDLIDGLQIDFNKNQIKTQHQNAIICGVEIDEYGKPVKYWFKEGDTDNYNVGKSIEIPADEVIHIFRSEFVGQTRGFGEIVASIDSLKQLDDFAVAELIAAKVAACQGVFYERNNISQAGDFLSSSETDEQGTFLSEISPGEASIVPQGYTVKTFTPNHPSSNFAGFVKAITRRIASSIGISYNRLSHDYESVNYSSLREASIDEGKTYADIQRFLIENWKNIEYALWLKSYIINCTTDLRPKDYESYLDFQFLGRKDGWFDPAKDVIATERLLSLGLTNPIIEIERRGLDVDDILDGWSIWNQKCENKKLVFGKEDQLPLDAVNQMNEEANNPESEDEENINNSNSNNEVANG